MTHDLHSFGWPCASSPSMMNEPVEKDSDNRCKSERAAIFGSASKHLCHWKRGCFQAVQTVAGAIDNLSEIAFSGEFQLIFNL